MQNKYSARLFARFSEQPKLEYSNYSYEPWYVIAILYLQMTNFDKDILQNY